MRIARKIAKWVAGLAIVALVGLAAWLYFAPPAMIRVATGYAAKIVYSNVFIAGREPGEVLRADVQAPGHPILKLINVVVDESAGTVSAGLFGLFGKGLAVDPPREPETPEQSWVFFVYRQIRIDLELTEGKLWAFAPSILLALLVTQERAGKQT